MSGFLRGFARGTILGWRLAPIGALFLWIHGRPFDVATLVAIGLLLGGGAMAWCMDLPKIRGVR